MPVISKDIFENAIDSLEESLKKYDEGLNGNAHSFKFAILNAAHYVELSLKHIITMINPILIYEDPCADKLNISKTISMWEALNFIKNMAILDESFDEQEKSAFLKDIQWLKQIRNDIQHSSFKYDIKQARHTLGRIFNSLNEIYLMRHMQPIKELLTNKSLTLYLKFIDEYEKELLMAETDAHEWACTHSHVSPHAPVSDNSYDEILKICPSCGHKTFILNDCRYICLFCNNTSETETCDWCNETFPQDFAVEGLAESIYFCSKECFEKDIDFKD